MVREIYSLRETLTKNFEVNSTNVTESNKPTNARTNEHTNGGMDKRQGKNYIPLGINAGGIITGSLKGGFGLFFFDKQRMFLAVHTLKTSATASTEVTSLQQS